MWEYNNLEELYHHGILGMKWGRRKSNYTSKDYRRTKALRKKRTNQLSNNELKELNNRYQLESTYNKNKAQRNVGRKIVVGSLATAGAIAGGIGAYNTIKTFVTQGDGKKVIDSGKRIVDSLRNMKR